MFRLYSSLRCTAQELVWNSVIDSVNANADLLNDRFDELAGDRSKADGSLTLDDSLGAPDYYDAVDVHLMPGNYDGGDADKGVLPGAVYDNGFNVFAFGAMGMDESTRPGGGGSTGDSWDGRAGRAERMSFPQDG